MDSFVADLLRLIDRYSLVLYAVSVLGILFYFVKAREAAEQRRYTPFPIEREEASAMQRDAMVLMLLFAAILAATFYIDRVLQPASAPPSEQQEQPAPAESTPQGSQETRPAQAARATASPTVKATSPAIGVLPSATASLTRVPSPTRTPRPTRTAQGESPTPEQPPGTAEASASPATSTPPSPVSTPLPRSTPPTVTAIPTQPPPPSVTPPPQPTTPPPPTSPPVPPARCPTTGVQISSPGNGASLSGTVAIQGTASIERFQFYKLEVGAGGNPGSFSSLGDVVRSPVAGGTLGSWATNGFARGIWTLRLTVVDETGNFPTPCDIHVVLP